MPLQGKWQWFSQAVTEAQEWGGQGEALLNCRAEWGGRGPALFLPAAAGRASV